MIVSIDRVGRLVIPKGVRDALGLTPDTQLDVVVDGGGIRLEPVDRHERRVEIVDGLPRLSAVSGTVVSDEDVRRLRDADQR